MNIVSKYRQVQQLLFSCILFSLNFPIAIALEVGKPTSTATGRVTISAGLGFDSGDYGTASKTDTFRIPFSLSYSKGSFFTGASIPYISATSSSDTVVVSGGGFRMNTFTSRTSTTSSTIAGLGDLNVHAGYRFPVQNSMITNYTITSRLKLATADETKGLGTGENDYAIEFGVVNRSDTSSLFANVGYQFIGDSALVKYNDIVYANIGFTTPLPHESGKYLGAMFDYIQSATPGFDDGLELTGFMSMLLADKRSLYLYGTLGLSNGSPDYGLGMSYGVGF